MFKFSNLDCHVMTFYPCCYGESFAQVINQIQVSAQNLQRRLTTLRMNKVLKNSHTIFDPPSTSHKSHDQSANTTILPLTSYCRYAGV